MGVYYAIWAVLDLACVAIAVMFTVSVVSLGSPWWVVVVAVGIGVLGLVAINGMWLDMWMTERHDRKRDDPTER